MYVCMYCYILCPKKVTTEFGIILISYDDLYLGVTFLGAQGTLLCGIETALMMWHVQVQLNLARQAIVRLQKVLGIQPPASHMALLESVDGPVDIDGSITKTLLQNASTDKLRVLAEFLLDTLLGMTNAGSTIPDVPTTLYSAFTPSFASSLFHSLCVHGTRKTQTHAGVLLVRICAAQPWWGEFLCNMLKELFATDHAASVFPHDR